MKSPQLKSWFRKVHWLLAVLASLPLLVLGATGALLVFPTWLSEVGSGISYQVAVGGERLSYDAIVTSMQRALPEGDVPTRIVFPPDKTGVVTATTKLGNKIVLDPYTGQALEVSRATSGLHSIVLHLHVNLMAGKVGYWITGLSAIAVCLLSISGIVLWWPVGALNWSYLLVNWSNGWKRTNFDLHRVAGFYVSCFLLVIGATGAAMVFWPQAEAIVGLITWSKPSETRPMKVTQQTGPTISPNAAVELAMENYPGHELYRLYVPAKPEDPYRVFLNKPEQMETRLTEVRLVINPYSGAIEHTEDPSTRSRADTVMMWVLPLHYGTIGGLPLRIFYIFVSLSPWLLGVTGTLLWLQRRRKKRASPKPIATP